MHYSMLARLCITTCRYIHVCTFIHCSMLARLYITTCRYVRLSIAPCWHVYTLLHVGTFIIQCTFIFHVLYALINVGTTAY
jgi:hypothetical protein